MKTFKEWLTEAQVTPRDMQPKYILQFKVGKKVYYRINPSYMKNKVIISFKNINFEREDYLTTDVDKAWEYRGKQGQSLHNEEIKILEKHPKILQHLFGDEEVSMKVVKVK